VSTLASPDKYELQKIEVIHKNGYIHNVRMKNGYMTGAMYVENDIRLHVVYPLKIVVDKEKVQLGDKVKISAKNVKEGINKVSLVYQSTNNGKEYPVTLD